MKIVFLAPSLDFEKNGLADYCRHLATEITTNNHSAVIISVNDISPDNVIPFQDSLISSSIKCYKLSSKYSWITRARLLSRILLCEKPDWVSLQFVCYGFFKKGIIWNALAPIAWVLRSYHLQVMYHEPWIGCNVGASFKYKCVGFLQKLSIALSHKFLRPHLTHTSNNYYQEILRTAGIKAEILPLFGNISISETINKSLIKEKLQKNGVSNEFLQSDHLLTVCHFGSFYFRENDFPIILNALCELNNKLSKHVLLLFIGSIGEKNCELLLRLNDISNSKHPNKLLISHIGRLSEVEVSQVLQLSDVGITSSPYNTIGKSGTALAILDHGLKVICIRDDYHAINNPSLRAQEINGVIHVSKLYLETNLQKLLQKEHPKASIKAISKEFIKLLCTASNS